MVCTHLDRLLRFASRGQRPLLMERVGSYENNKDDRKVGKWLTRAAPIGKPEALARRSQARAVTLTAGAKLRKQRAVTARWEVTSCGYWRTLA